ncbi:TetR/AcrR family transcriptional regulator [Thermostaphylospora chromogena]|uniref:DNA-binding transcriptional regulator, AcrR family n=1 Tax=Thermostaphylospora chromogena TaxID=35622 RepID=A0A1H1CAF2_9ACTN|nr:TetR/AcrR family transcriptional regulator [Thermostaphylospora chromogena]SDQ61181.1 DNA-binding transcriptional regulator, AcrR family [Thermostaphylospora chromogena]
MTTRDEPRNARSQRTRAAILAAMRALLEEEGFEALTMGAVAERAGVSRRALYLHFASRTELVTSLFDYLAEQEGLSESLRRVWEAPDAVGTLKEWARHMAHYTPRLFAVDRAVNRVWSRDPDVAQHRDRIVASQRRNARMMAERLHDQGVLSPVWTVDTATDMLWALMSTEVVERLIRWRNWPNHEFADRYFALLRATFISPDRDADQAEGRNDPAPPADTPPAAGTPDPA